MSGGSLKATEDDVVDALCLRSPVACRVELPEAGQREDHVLGVETALRRARKPNPRPTGASGRWSRLTRPPRPESHDLCMTRPTREGRIGMPPAGFEPATRGLEEGVCTAALRRCGGELPASRRFPGDASRHERPREDAIRSRALLRFPWVRDAADRRFLRAIAGDYGWRCAASRDPRQRRPRGGEWEAIDGPGSAESASNVPQYPV